MDPTHGKPQYNQALSGLAKIHELSTVHGDSAPRNLVVPRSDPLSPVWIDLLPSAPDVECAVVWKNVMRLDIMTFNVGVFMEGRLSCRSCIADLDAWCQEHVSPYVPLEERRNAPTGAAADIMEAWYDYLDVLRAKEADLRKVLLQPWIEAGFTLETNPPSDVLVSTSSQVWKDTTPS